MQIPKGGAQTTFPLGYHIKILRYLNQIAFRGGTHDLFFIGDWVWDTNIKNLYSIKILTIKFFPATPVHSSGIFCNLDVSCNLAQSSNKTRENYVQS